MADRERHFGRLVIQLWVLAFVGLFGTFFTVVIPAARLPVIAAFGLPLLGWAAVRLRGPRDILDVGIFCALVALAIVAAVGVDPLGSLETVGLALGYAVLFWLTRHYAGDPERRSTVAVPVATAVTVWLLVAAVVWIGDKVAWVSFGGGMPRFAADNGLLWGTPNSYPVLVLLGLPFITAIEDHRVRRVITWAFVAGAVLVTPMSDGRAGWLGLGVGVIAHEALTGWAVVRRIWMTVTSWRRPRAIIGIAAAIITAGVLFTLPRLVGVAEVGLEPRFRLWRQAMGILADDPLSGSGPGTFSWVRLAHVPAMTDPVPVTVAHNVWLQTLSDGGIVLGAGLAAAAGLWVLTLWHRRTFLDRTQRISAAAVIGFSATVLLDDFSYLPAIIAMLVTLAAWTVPVVDGEEGPGFRRGWIPVGAGALLALAFVAALPVERATLAATAAQQEALAGDWRTAEAGFELASNDHPTDPLHYLDLGFARAELGERSASTKAYTQARSLSPADPRILGALAALSDADGVELLTAASRHSMDAQYAYRLAMQLLDVDRPGEAVDAYALAVALRSDLYAALPPEGADLDRPAVRDRALDVARQLRAIDPAHADRVAWDIGLVDASLPADAPAAWRAVAAAAAGRTNEAEAEIDTARRDAPYSPETHLAAAAVARFTCDEPAYERAIRLAGPERAEPLPDLAIVRDPIYDEPGLGDYQPSWVPRLPKLPRWPFGLLDMPACGWQP